MTLKWSIPEILEHQRNGLTIDTTVSIEDLKERDTEIRDTSPVHVTGYADFDRQSVTFFLTITGKLTLPDALTLEDVDYPFHIQTWEMFRLRAGSSAFDADDDPEVHDVQAQTIDLLSYIKEAILVEKPIRVV
ncbi:MAG: YceD family protein, partial [Tuberibacillus sp.]